MDIRSWRPCSARCRLRGCGWIIALVAVAAGLRVTTAAAVSPDQIAFFETKIRPIFVAHCWKCHADDAKGGLRLDGRDAALAGGDSGPAVEPGKPDASLLVRAVRYADPAYQMPPSGKLPAASIRALEEWVALGAPYATDTAAAGARPVRRGEFFVSDADREHWAYRPVARPPIPAGRAASPVDAWLDAKLAAQGLAPNGQASPRELVRRAWFDLVGLPPSFEDVAAFERDSSDAAWAALVERLLAMPAYGERWGRHWLDVVRFAQTNGYERDAEKPHVWRYRDWVIAAFNADMPYDRFLREQIAGDLLEPPTDSGLIGSGFWHLGTWDDEPDDARLARYDELDDMISAVGQGFLGMTINCARCHDHKFDPVGQRDYYSLLGMVHGIRRYSPKHGTEKRKTKDSDHEETVEIDADAFARLASGDGWALCAVDGPAAGKARVLVRGNPGSPGVEVEPGLPEVLRGVVPAGTDSHRRDRRALAAWIADTANPLTARVLVNRVWQHHFGRGLVATPNDFGLAGEPPTHPELLDWLAAEFTEGGWSVKHLHRVIMASAAYRRSSRADTAACVAVDEDNTLWWRQNPRRLEAEAIRDAFLTAAGTLNPAAGGRGFFTTVGRDSLAGQSKPGKGWEISPPAEQQRRSVYGFVKRTLLVPEIESFDFANTTSPVGQRSVTTVSPQALLLSNGAFAREQAAAMAERIRSELGAEAVDDGRFVTRGFELAFARRPTDREREVAAAYLARQRSAWSSEADVVSLRPLVPAALVEEHRRLLPPHRILAVVPAGWLVGGGVWGGGYEGIRNLDLATGPFALWTGPRGPEPVAGFDDAGRFIDGVVEAEVFVRGATELAAVVIRGLSSGDGLEERFTGYEVAVVPPLKLVELRKVTEKGASVLASVKRELPADAWLHVRLEADGGRLTATLDRESTPQLAAEDAEPIVRPGHLGLRTWGAALEARNVVVVPRGAVAVRADPATPPDAREAAARAARDLCLLILNMNEFIHVD